MKNFRAAIENINFSPESFGFLHFEKVEKYFNYTGKPAVNTGSKEAQIPVIDKAQNGTSGTFVKREPKSKLPVKNTGNVKPSTPQGGPKKRDRDAENGSDQRDEKPVKFVKRENTDSPRCFNENSRENNLSENYTSELSPGAEKLVAGPGKINDQLGDAFGKELTDFNLIKTAGEEKTIKAILNPIQ